MLTLRKLDDYLPLSDDAIFYDALFVYMQSQT
jgi:hypothetical protein